LQVIIHRLAEGLKEVIDCFFSSGYTLFMLDLSLQDMLLVNFLIGVLLGNLSHHGRHNRSNWVLPFLVREERLAIGCKIVLVKIVLVVWGFFQLVPELMDELLTLIFLGRFRNLLFLDFFLLVRDLLSWRGVSLGLMIKRSNKTFNISEPLLVFLTETLEVIKSLQDWLIGGKRH
jgi:hypothetical protein